MLKIEMGVEIDVVVALLKFGSKRQLSLRSNVARLLDHLK